MTCLLRGTHGEDCIDRFGEDCIDRFGEDCIDRFGTSGVFLNLIKWWTILR